MIARFITPDHVAEEVSLGPSPEAHLEAIREYIDAGFGGNAGGMARDLLMGAVPPAAISDWRHLAVSLLAGIVCRRPDHLAHDLPRHPKLAGNRVDRLVLGEIRPTDLRDCLHCQHPQPGPHIPHGSHFGPDVWGVRWEWSLPIIATYDVPRAHDSIPETYRSLGDLPSFGRCVPVRQTEYQILFGLDIDEVALHLSERAQTVLSLNTDDRALRFEISRLVIGIKNDIAAAGTARTGVNPMRFMPNDSDLFSMLIQRWESQDGMCALCDRPIPLKPETSCSKCHGIEPTARIRLTIGRIPD